MSIALICLASSGILNLFFLAKMFKRLYWQYYLRKPFKTFKYERDKLFETLDQHSTDIIFLGDSNIQHFELFEYLKSPYVKNRGIGGDTSSGAAQRTVHISKGKPDKCFIQIGINDVLQQVEQSQIIDNFRTIIQLFEKNSPQTKLYIQSLPPVSNKKESILGRLEANKVIRSINDQLRHLCTNHQLTFIDIHSSLFYKGGIKESYTIDGLHLTGEGYHIMSQVLLPYVMETNHNEVERSFQNVLHNTV